MAQHGRTSSTSGLITSASSDTTVRMAVDGQPWDKPRCFVIHAWSPSYSKRVLAELRRLLEPTFLFDADDCFGGNSRIRETAVEGIEQASLVICLLDHLTPNVTFEYGCAEAFEKPCIPMFERRSLVNVRKYFRKGKHPRGLRNPRLEIVDHFSDFGNKKYVHYDRGRLEELGRIIADQFALRDETQKRLDRRILETWVALLRTDCPEPNCFARVEECILQTRSMRLGRALFSEKRRREYRRLLREAFGSSSKEKRRTRVTNRRASL